MLEHRTLDIISSILLTTIMSITAGRMYADGKLDLLYLTVTFGTLLSSVVSSLNFQLKTFSFAIIKPSDSRNKLTLLTAFMLTLTTFVSIIGFHLIRNNLNQHNTYKLPINVRNLSVTSGSDVFRYHFFADFIPGLIILSQAHLCSIFSYNLMNKAKRRFSYGEASLVSQLLTSAYIVWALSLYTKLSGAGPFRVDQTTDIVLNLGMLIFVIVLFPSFYLIPKNRNTTLIRYTILVLALVAAYLVAQNLVATKELSDPLTWLIDYIFSTHQRISLFSLWLATVAACVSFSTSWSRLVGQTNSLVRKVFHMAVCVIFITGFNQDLDFTRFASSGMIVVMFTIELVRIWNLWPIGSHLESVCHALRGKWDNRYLTLSHIYLLVGTMLPLWLLPKGSSKLLLSSGLISVGIGDTAAAIIGTFYGKRKLFPKSDKTLEGFAGNFAAMALFKLIWVGYTGFQGEFSFAMAALCTAFVETISPNCDNLILPLVMILFLELF